MHAANVIRLPAPGIIKRVERDGFEAFERFIDDLLDQDRLTQAVHAEFLAWARRWLRNRARINPTPTAQRTWREQGAELRARRAARTHDNRRHERCADNAHAL
jgi:hypothetical protein